VSDESPVLDSRTSAELAHAEIAHLLAVAGVPTLAIKGPTVALWLYPDDTRSWGDVDVWLPPHRMDDAVAALGGHGFTEVFPGVDHHTSEDHAVVLQRTVATTGGGEVDLHHRFPGADADPERVFAVLWGRRERTALAHTPVWVPDRSTRALLVVLNSARTTGVAQAEEDLRRVVAPDDPGGLPGVDWEDVVDLAVRVGALPALRAGLDLDPGGARVVASVPRLAAATASREWSLRSSGASRTAVRLAELGRVPPRERARRVARWVVPHPAVLRMRDPRTAHGRRALLTGYLRRLGQGARELPTALWELRGARRR
jgi:hypothetical protein